MVLGKRPGTGHQVQVQVQVSRYRYRYRYRTPGAGQATQVWDYQLPVGIDGLASPAEDGESASEKFF